MPYKSSFLSKFLVTVFTLERLENNLIQLVSIYSKLNALDCYPFISMDPFVNAQTFFRTYSMTTSAAHEIFERFGTFLSTMI